MIMVLTRRESIYEILSLEFNQLKWWWWYNIVIIIFSFSIPECHISDLDWRQSFSIICDNLGFPPVHSIHCWKCNWKLFFHALVYYVAESIFMIIVMQICLGGWWMETKAIFHIFFPYSKNTYNLDLNYS